MCIINVDHTCKREHVWVIEKSRQGTPADSQGAFTGKEMIIIVV